MTSEEFDRLVQGYFDNELSAKDFAALQRILASSAEARRRYRQLAEVHGLLGPLVAPRLEAPTLKRPPASMARTRVRRMIPALAVAAVFALAALVLHSLWAKQHRPLVTFRLSPETHFELTNLDSSQGAPSQPEHSMREGSRLQLRQGVVELQFASGVTGFVSGPADLTLTSKSELRLDQGRARFHVPPKAKGFKVTTSDMEVVDLGTEFGVVVPHSSEGAQVHVFAGHVKASIPGSSTVEELSAGAARQVEVDRSGFGKISLSETLFHQALPTSLPYLHWSFDDVGPQGLAATGSHPAQKDLITTPMQREGRSASDRLVPGVRGKALAFDGEGDYVRTNWPGIDGDTPRTVVMWVRYPQGVLPRYDAGGVVWGTRVSPEEPVCWKFNFMASAPSLDLHMHSPPKGVAYITFGRWWRYGTTNLADGRWHCIAVTYNGETGPDHLPDVHLFVDGQEEACQSVDNRRSERDRPPTINTRTDHPRSTPLMMGRSQERWDPDDKMPYHYFAGEIDELYIFEGVVDTGVLRRLAAERQLPPLR